jgi:hypothetical protein
MKAKTNLKFGFISDAPNVTMNISTINSNNTSNVAQVNQVTSVGTSTVTVASVPGTLAYAPWQMIWSGLVAAPLQMCQL